MAGNHGGDEDKSGDQNPADSDGTKGAGHGGGGSGDGQGNSDDGVKDPKK